MKIKKIVALTAACAMLSSTAGCQIITIDGEGTAEVGENGVVGNGAIGLSVSTLNNPFFVSLAEGAQAEAEEKGAELITVDAGDDAAKQTNDVEDLISRNVSVLIVNPVDSDAVAPAVKDAISKGIKVISVDRVVNGVDVDCQIASDNVAGAKMATEYLVETIGEGTPVAELQGTTGASATIDRGAGFHEVADEKLDVTGSQTADFNRATGMTVMENLLQANGSIKGVFAHNDEMALGALEAIAATGKDIKVVGFDATDDAVAAVKAGKMLATVAQQPDQMGKTAVDTAITLAEGETIIENAAKEPHVVDVANFLNSMGANVKGAGTDIIRIKGVRKLHGTEYSIIPDQIEAGTFMCAAAITRGDIMVQNVIPKHLEAITAKLIEMGCEVTEFDEAVRVVGKPRQKHMDIKTLPYPGFPTDMQPQITVTLALAEGTSVVTESIFENRFKYVDELSRMGCSIKVEGNVAIIDGVKGFTGATVNAPDLRAGAALVIAGLAAEGYTVVDEIGYIQRGYENFEEKLRGLGAVIEKVDSEKEAQKFRLKVG